MTVTRFRYHTLTCECGTKLRAETIFVLRKKEREHYVKCDAVEKKKADDAAVRAAQGNLFGAP